MWTLDPDSNKPTLIMRHDKGLYTSGYLIRNYCILFQYDNGLVVMCVGAGGGGKSS